jgi:(p)ppGpp synthase/HD superfamily hydrolase
MLLLKNNLKTFKKERIRRINATNKFDKKALKEWKKLITKEINKKDIKEIKFAFNFARKLKYNHGDSNLYFSHPLRVANMAVIHKKNIDINLTILALNHNILEVTNLSKKILSNLFGKEFYKKVSVLTVNRKLQWNKSYKKKYYKNINNYSYDVRVVKILDKLDNLFIIGLNPNEKIRIKYIDEIKEFVLPMVKKDIPDIYLYFKKLVQDSYNKGYYNINNINQRN